MLHASATNRAGATPISGVYEPLEAHFVEADKQPKSEAAQAGDGI